MSTHLIPHQLARLLYPLTDKFNEENEHLIEHTLNNSIVEIKDFSNNSVNCVYLGARFSFHYRKDEKRKMVCSREHHKKYMHYFKP